MIADQPIIDRTTDQPTAQSAEPTFELESTVLDLVTVVVGVFSTPGDTEKRFAIIDPAWERLRKLAEQLGMPPQGSK